MSKNIRGLVDDFHNHLRQEVALGHNYLGKQFVAQEMTGLVRTEALIVKKWGEL